MKTHKLSNHIILSGITVSMLFSPLMALPSGGKFTHGTSGTISIDKTNPNKPIMNVSGHGTNSVIQWGGGFNIANGEKVNFGNNNFKGQQNYLNIVHGTSKSTIAGILEAGNNNVFLINPNGVIITKTGTINANRFVASTSSLKPEDFDKFKAQGASFSPVFKPNGGNVVNMGTINAKNITLQGNKVMLSADTSWDDKNNKIKLNQITADNIDLKGNEVYVDISTINSNNLTTEAKNKGIAYLSATGYYYNPNSFKVFDKYTNTNDDNFKVYKYVGIGSDLDWWHFAKGWNENEDFRNTASGYRLTSNIDFKASNGQNYANYWVDLNGDGKKDANEFTNMIVGYKYDSVFTKTFDGQGYTLKNINIDTTGFFYPGKYNLSEYVGIFGKADGAKFKNINVDYMGGSVKAYGYGGDEEYIYIQKYTGGFAGSIENSEIDSINLKNLTYISTSSDKSKIGSIYLGGFVGEIKKTNTSNVVLKDIGTIEAVGNAVSVTGMFTGGFAGRISGGREFMYIKDIALENIDSIIAINTAGGSQDLSAGGFAGAIDSMAKDGYISHVKLNNINNIKSGSEDKIDGNINAGGFVGKVEVSENFNIKDIVVKNINHIYTGKSSLSESNSGGFAGSAFLNGRKNMFFRNIFIENIGNITSNSNSGGFIGSDSYGGANYVDITIKDIDNILSTKNSGGFVGFNNGGKYSKIYISDIKNISSKSIDKFDNLSNSFNYASGFIGFNNYGEFSDITVKNIGNISSISNGFAYSGGFVGGFDSGEFKRISLENITNISSIANSSNNGDSSAYSGGFAGSNIYNSGTESTFNINNISLKGIKNITSEAKKNAYAGGFAGQLTNNYSGGSSSINFLKNIYIEGIDYVKANGRLDAQAGGFAGSLNYVDIDNVELNNIKEINAESLGKKAFSTFAGGFVGITNRYSNFENIVLNNFGSISANGSYPVNNDAGGFVGYAFSSDPEIPIIFNNISLNNFGNIIGKNASGGFSGSDSRVKMSNISLNDINYIQGGSAGGFSGHSESSYENIVLNNIKHIKGVYAGGFTGSGRGGKNIYIYFDKGAIIEGSESSGKFFGKFHDYSDTENTYIYYHKDDLTNANIDQKYWELYKWIELRPYDDNSQGYIDFKTAALAALNGLKEIDCGASKKCLVFTKDFEIEKPSNPNISEPNYPNNVVVSKPSQDTDYIPSTEDIIKETATLDENDLYKDIIINEIISDLKNKYYTIDIADLKAILEAYKNLDKNSAEARTKFIMDYFFDKNNKDNPSIEIAQKEIFQSLDFLLAYQDNGLSKASDDKFADNEAIQAKDNILAEVSNALENKTIASNLENLSNLNDKINSANNDFKEENYYKQLNDLASAYNKYVELINKGLVSKDDQAFKDISNELFDLIAKVGDETEAIERLIKDFEDLKISVSDESSGHFVVKGELSAIKIPYPILASIKDDNGGGEIEIPDKPIDPVEPPIDNKPDDSLAFEQSSTFNSIGNETLNEEEETEEIDETSLIQKSKTCIVSDNYKTMNPCVVGGL